MSPSITHTRAQLAAGRRHHPDQDHTGLQTELKALTLEQHVRRIVDSAPPLTSDQLDRIARILVPIGGER
jgi:hypothetical protein